MDVMPTGDAQDAGAPSTVNFAYHPQWTGVTAVTVLGTFTGGASDWKTPIATLANDGSGTWRGSALLLPGTYLYVFKTLGDDGAGTTLGPNFPHVAIDPDNSAIADCPMGAPCFSSNPADHNPASELTVPQNTPPAEQHITGTIVDGDTPVANYMVVVERTDTGYHHYFVNRTTTQSDGSYDLSVAAGAYRLQVLYPTFYAQTDADRDPPTGLAAMLRLISSSFPVSGSPVGMPGGEVSFAAYGSFAPTKTGTLPTTFSFHGVGGAPSRLEVYGTGMDGGAPNIGDPWFSGPTVTTGTSDFDGGFNTAQAGQTSVSLGERYFWGIEQTLGAGDAGVTWTAQTMVFDMTWH